MLVPGLVVHKAWRISRVHALPVACRLDPELQAAQASLRCHIQPILQTPCHVHCSIQPAPLADPACHAHRKPWGQYVLHTRLDWLQTLHTAQGVCCICHLNAPALCAGSSTTQTRPTPEPVHRACLAGCHMQYAFQINTLFCKQGMQCLVQPACNVIPKKGMHECWARILTPAMF